MINLYRWEDDVVSEGRSESVCGKELYVCIVLVHVQRNTDKLTM